MASASVINGVSIYALSTGKTLPSWIPEKKRKALNRDLAFRRRIELIQDFEFPEASHSLSMSTDGRYIIATGTYPPRVRVFDTVELSLKFERYMDATPVDAVCLGEDYSKLAFLQDDRNVELHAAYGKHYRTRIPKFGRSMKLHAPTSELLVGASGSEVYRLSLEQGRFLAPYTVDAPAVNQLAISRVTALIAMACEGGTVELWDPRVGERVGRVSAPSSAPSSSSASSHPSVNRGMDATAVCFEEGGLGLTVGTSDGRALVYDLRHSAPVVSKRHPYGLPVTHVAYHRGKERLVISTDAKGARIWHKDDGKVFTNVETPAAVNAVCVASDEPGVGGSDSGLLLMAGEQERVMAYYVPAMGVAPKWCAFLDSLTEELEEGKSDYTSGAAGGGGGGDASAGAVGSVFDDYRFVTRDELASMGLSHLVGTPMLKAYMHGFFMDARLHAKVRAVVDSGSGGGAAGKGGASYDKWKADKVKAAVEAQRGSRIALDDGLPKVNRELAKKLLESQSAAAAGGGKGSGKPAKKARREEDEDAATAVAAAGPAAGPGGILADPRFARLFSDPAFAIDSEEADVIAIRRGTGGGSGGGGGGAGKAGGGAGAGKLAGNKRRRRGSDADSGEEG